MVVVRRVVGVGAAATRLATAVTGTGTGASVVVGSSSAVVVVSGARSRAADLLARSGTNRAVNSRGDELAMRNAVLRGRES